MAGVNVLRKSWVWFCSQWCSYSRPNWWEWRRRTDMSDKKWPWGHHHDHMCGATGECGGTMYPTFGASGIGVQRSTRLGSSTQWRAVPRY